MSIYFTKLKPCDLGMIPDFLSLDDPRPAREQFNENYAHGGGWRPYGQGKWKLNSDGYALRYPGDPLFRPLAIAQFRDEVILFYDCALVCIMQKDGSFEVSRMD